VTLLGDVATKIELGGTRNPDSFDAYLRGQKAYLSSHASKNYQTAIAAYTDAIGIDPTYALAFARRSLAHSVYAADYGTGPAIRESFDKAQSDARRAIALAPDLAEGHLALGSYFENGSLDFVRANAEYERALALAPGNAQALRDYGTFAVNMGRAGVGIAAARRAVILDPLGSSHFTLGQALYFARQNREAVAAFQDALAVDPEDALTYSWRGFAYYALGDLERARVSCETKPDDWGAQWCLTVVYDKLSRRADAEAVLAKLKAANGDASAYQYATIYAQWGNASKALEWLDTAMRLRDPGLEYLKTDPLMDPLRKQPHFQAVMRELKFPD
jgi:serine/threonine-protein kinase